jgi:hypothetical protein
MKFSGEQLTQRSSQKMINIFSDEGKKKAHAHHVRAFYYWITAKEVGLI